MNIHVPSDVIERENYKYTWGYATYS